MTKIYFICLTLLASTVYAGQSFTDTPVCPSEQPTAKCDAIGVVAAYKESVRYLKDVKKIKINSDYTKWCGLEGVYSDGARYHFVLRSSKSKCTYNVWISCSTGTVPEEKNNSFDEFCEASK